MADRNTLHALAMALVLAAVSASAQTDRTEDRPRPPAVVIGGSVAATIRLIPVPNGTRPHDPLAAHDGTIWYSGEASNRLGRVDPKTGTIREYVLPTPGSGPLGLAEDREGDIWYAAHRAGLVGRLDPATGRIAEFQMPVLEARDPHGIAIDARGTVWFTLPESNMIGRLKPADGKVTLARVPAPRAWPEAIRIGRDGVPVVALTGTNMIAAIDPTTMAVAERALPHPDARPCGLAIGPDGALWYTDIARGFLGRLDLKTGVHKEWLSPSGAKSRPYGIVFARGAVWFSESYAAPNTIVRFDPVSARFESWEIPGGGDIVRGMDVTPEGNPVTAHSLTNQVGLVKVEVQDQ